MTERLLIERLKSLAKDVRGPVKEALLDAGIALAEAERTRVDLLLAWLQAPNPRLGGVTPLWMLENGRGERLAAYVHQAIFENSPPPKMSPAPEGSRVMVVDEEPCHTAWLIERDFETGGSEFWTGEGSTGFSRTPLTAIRFCRREDAETVIRYLLPTMTLHAREHVWVDHP